MDEYREAVALMPAEKAFLELALRAWRVTNSAGRKKLRADLALVILDQPAQHDR